MGRSVCNEKQYYITAHNKGDITEFTSSHLAITKAYISLITSVVTIAAKTYHEANECSFLFQLLGMVGAAVCRPEPPLSFGGGLALDSYAAPISGGGGGDRYGPPPVYGPPQQAPVIHKHVYVHVPPPEPTYYAPRRPAPPPPPQKHYKIVFIKAPTPPPPTVPDIPIIPQNEQKTLIYVLVKKPDEQPEITIPTPAPTQPSKPEVYFIRYKTQVSDPSDVFQRIFLVSGINFISVNKRVQAKGVNNLCSRF